MLKSVTAAVASKFTSQLPDSTDSHHFQASRLLNNPVLYCIALGHFPESYMTSGLKPQNSALNQFL